MLIIVEDKRHDLRISEISHFPLSILKKEKKSNSWMIFRFSQSLMKFFFFENKKRKR